MKPLSPPYMFKKIYSLLQHPRSLQPQWWHRYHGILISNISLRSAFNSKIISSLLRVPMSESLFTSGAHFAFRLWNQTPMRSGRIRSYVNFHESEDEVVYQWTLTRAIDLSKTHRTCCTKHVILITECPLIHFKGSSWPFYRLLASGILWTEEKSAVLPDSNS